MRAAPRRGPEAALLAAIHAWTAGPQPRLQRLLPDRGGDADPVLLLGAGFCGGPLTVHFGDRATWAVALSDDLALTTTPAGAVGPVSVSRHGLRSGSLGFGDASDDGPARVVRIDPRDGATGVFRDTPVVARLSRPLDPGSLDPGSFRVLDDRGPVPARLLLSPDALVVVWQAERPLAPGVPHVVAASGLRDERGRPVAPHLSRFLPCPLSRQDLFE